MTRHIGLAACLILVLGCGSSPVPTTTQAVSPTPTASNARPTELVTASPSPTDTTSPTLPTHLPPPTPNALAPWEERFPTGIGEVEELSAVAFGDGVSVLTGNGPSGEPRIWFSTDALHWQASDFPDIPGLTRFNQVLADDGRIIVFADGWVGNQELTYVYTSASGSDWVLAGSVSGRVTKVGVSGGQIAAFGSGTDGQPAAWTSIDATTWTTATEPSASTVANGMLAVHTDAAGLWAVRSNDPSGAGTADPVEVWRSDDGQVWTKVADLPRSVSVTEATMASGPDGFVISAVRVTFSGPSAADYKWYAWQSPDGTVWTRSDTAPRSADYLLADANGFIAVGGDYGHCCATDSAEVQGVIWVSADGSRWTKVFDRDWYGRVIEGLTLVGDTLIGVGVDWSDPTRGLGAIWTADRAEVIAGI